MKNEDLEIAEPCSKAWGEMRGDEKRRHCDHCDKSVHNISEMTEAEATALVSGDFERVCVRYRCDSGGEIEFKDRGFNHRLRQQLRGVRNLLAAGAFVLPIFTLDTCDNLSITDITPSPMGMFEGVMMGEVEMRETVGKPAFIPKKVAEKPEASGSGL